MNRIRAFKIQALKIQALKPHLVAVLITAHFLCILLHLLPYPPRLDQKSLELPDVRAEIDYFVNGLHSLLHYQGSHASLKRDLIDFVREYNRQHEKVRSIVRLYLEPTGQIQTWNMFGGTPPRHPRVVMVKIRPVHQADWIQFQDGRWGTLTDETTNFRHRKAQERLSVPGRKKQRIEYAQYQARLWNQRHPESPAAAVDLYFLELSTPRAQDVQRGVAAPAPREVEHMVLAVQDDGLGVAPASPTTRSPHPFAQPPTTQKNQEMP